MVQILVVENDLACYRLTDYLAASGVVVDTACDGVESPSALLRRP